ncbi:MAG TPA: chemotaxis response regulator protein-glutamate methylesterase [Vulgatibacter sp.]|nr:chemotaxis response regulator protein-glutamate methylesterase [Vulgatibacter sp.]
MIRVLVVDDSAVVRQLCQQVLSKDPDIQVVGTAPDPYVARDLILELNPEVMTLDVEMPRMDGISFLRRVMRFRPIPTIVLSSLTPKGGDLAMDALDAGAVDVLCKPGASYTLGEMASELVASVKRAATAEFRRPVAHANAPLPAAQRPLARMTNQILAIGASTGGTVAIEKILRAMPANGPATVIAQHMPPAFTAQFANRLNAISKMEVREATHEEWLSPGVALVAPGGKHLVLRRSGARYLVHVKDGPLVGGYRPSVDVLLRSVALAAGRNAVGVVLTGMGADGARGLLEMRSAGAATIAQDEATSVVYGMPKVAFETGAAELVLPIDQITPRILKIIEARDMQHN